MFKKLVIELAGPICNCHNENLAWGIGSDSSLHLMCKVCQAKVVVPYEKLTASFALKRPYPGSKKLPILKEGKGKVIPLFRHISKEEG